AFAEDPGFLIDAANNSSVAPRIRPRESATAQGSSAAISRARSSQMHFIEMRIVSLLGFPNPRQTNQVVKFLEFDHPVVEGRRRTSPEQLGCHRGEAHRL